MNDPCLIDTFAGDDKLALSIVERLASDLYKANIVTRLETKRLGYSDDGVTLYKLYYVEGPVFDELERLEDERISKLKPKCHSQLRERRGPWGIYAASRGSNIEFFVVHTASPKQRTVLLRNTRPLIEAYHANLKELAERDTFSRKLRDLAVAASDYLSAVESLGKINPDGKSFFEGSPTTDPACGEAWIRLNDSGKDLRVQVNSSFEALGMLSPAVPPASDAVVKS